MKTLQRFKKNMSLPFQLPELTVIQNLIILIVMTGFISLYSFWLQPNSMIESLAMIKHNPTLVLLNGAPILVFALVIYLIFNNIWLGTSVSSALFLVLSTVNRFKVQFRDEPLVPMDLKLAREAKGMVTEGGFQISYTLIACLILFIAIQLLLAFAWKSKPMKAYWQRAVAVILVVACGYGANSFVYSSATTYNSFKILNGNQYNATTQYNNRGFIYSFIYNFSAFKVAKPEHYQKSEIEDLIKKYSSPEIANAKSTSKVNTSTKKPHVIMIMGEAYTDFINQTDLTFKKDESPLQFFNQMNSDQTLKGHIVVPTYGGGTANTEYESLTGGANLYLNKTLTTAYTIIRKPTDALPSELKKVGYDSIGMHPGYGWFYNRQNVYGNFGFDKAYFQDDFSQTHKGNYLSEAVTIDKIIDVFKKHTEESDNPLFEFCVTIQNHGPYDDSGHYGNEKVTWKTSKTLSADTTKTLSNYLVGLRDADRQMERLVQYFDSIDEPVVLVYYGDHLPFLGDDYKGFKELGFDLNPNGTTEQRLNTYKTPYLLWKNKAAMDTVHFENLQLPEDHVINVGYLAGIVFDLIGERNATPYMAFLNEMRMILPVFRGSEFHYEGKSLDNLPKDSPGSDYLKKLVDWQYYRLK